MNLTSKDIYDIPEIRNIIDDYCSNYHCLICKECSDISYFICKIHVDDPDDWECYKCSFKKCATCKEPLREDRPKNFTRCYKCFMKSKRKRKRRFNFF